MAKQMSTKYKVNMLIGEGEDGSSHRFSHVGTQKWDCQSMWASAVKSGNKETQILVSKAGAPFVPDEEAMAYARKRFNLDVVGYDVTFHEALVEHASVFADLAKKVKKIEYTAEDLDKAVAHINDIYDLLNEKRAELENDQSESAN